MLGDIEVRFSRRRRLRPGWRRHVRRRAESPVGEEISTRRTESHPHARQFACWCARTEQNHPDRNRQWHQIGRQATRHLQRPGRRSADRLAAPRRRQPDEVDLVINTHLHFDHAGGNTRIVERPSPFPPSAMPATSCREQNWSTPCIPPNATVPAIFPITINPSPTQASGIWWMATRKSCPASP